MIEDDDDDMETARIDAVQPWLPPVSSASELPRGAVDGSLCFVHGSDSVWQYRSGKWNEIGRSPTAPR